MSEFLILFSIAAVVFLFTYLLGEWLAGSTLPRLRGRRRHGAGPTGRRPERGEG